MQLVQPQQPMELTTFLMEHTTLTGMQGTQGMATLVTVDMVMVSSSTESMEASSSMESMGNMVCLEEANSRSGSNLKKQPLILSSRSLIT